jgi:hypothetical protein
MKAEFTMVLAKMAVRRQAEIDDATYTVYVDDLIAANVELADLQGACDELGKAPREAYQSAFPSVGDLLKVCRMRRRLRIDREIEAQYGNRPLLTEGPPMSKDSAAKWLDRIKYAARHGLDALKARDEAQS